MKLIVNGKQRANSQRNTVLQEGARLEELLAKLRRSQALTKQTEVMHLMLSLAGEGGQGAEQQQAPIIESVFSKKILNNLDYNKPPA